MFDIFEAMLAGSEIEYNGKKYVYVKSFSPKDGLILAVELGAELPAPVVVIKQPDPLKPKSDSIKENQDG